jgi:hypothetical protein
MDLTKGIVKSILIHYYRFALSKDAAADLGLSVSALINWFNTEQRISETSLIKLRNLLPTMKEKKQKRLDYKIAKFERLKQINEEKTKTFELQLNAIILANKKGKKVKKELEDFDLSSSKRNQKDA